MKTIADTKSPPLRFENDNGKEYPRWIQRRVKEICKINPKNNELPNKFIYIDLESVEKGRLLSRNEIVKSNAPSRAQRLLRKKDVLIQTVRPYQQNNLHFDLDGNFVASTGYSQLRTSDSSRFLYYLFHVENTLNKILSYCTGTSYPAIASNDLGEILVFLPVAEEQQKIASFFSSIDTRIEQLEKKKSLFEQLRKGLMQKLFTQEIRFKDDQGNKYQDWEIISLSQLGQTYGGLSGKSKDDFGDGKKYVQYLQVFENSRVQLENCGLVRILQGEYQHRVCKGDVLFTISSETRDEVGISSVVLDEIDELYLNSFCFGLRLNSNKLSPDFARYLFRNHEFRREMYRLSQGSTRFNLSKKAVMGISVFVPHHQEQQNIADFLASLDRKLEQIKEQINQTREFKKGLLQQMFV